MWSVEDLPSVIRKQVEHCFGLSWDWRKAADCWRKCCRKK